MPFGITASARARSSASALLVLLMSSARSMIAHVAADLAPKHPVGPAGVEQDDGQQDERADQQKRLGALRRLRLPKRDRGRNDQRPKADADAQVRDQEEADGAQERLGLRRPP